MIIKFIINLINRLLISYALYTYEYNMTFAITHYIILSPLQVLIIL